MEIEKFDLWMPDSFKKRFLLRADEYEEAFEKMMEIQYVESLYRTGPIFYIQSEKDKNMERREIIFHMPIWMPIEGCPDDFPYDLEDELEIEDTILMRQAETEESLSIARKKMEEYANKKYNKVLSDTSYVICNDIYDEFFINLCIPMIDD